MQQAYVVGIPVLDQKHVKYSATRNEGSGYHFYPVVGQKHSQLPSAILSRKIKMPSCKIFGYVMVTHPIHTLEVSRTISLKPETALMIYVLMHGDWIIQSSEGYWSNQNGWVERKKDATVYKGQNHNLPAGEHVQWAPTI